MDERAEWVYLVEILAQYRSAQRARSRMTEEIVAFYKGSDATARERIAELFDDVADFLQHAANVSKMLWPNPRAKERAAKERALARGRHLRASLALTDAGHVLADRQLRNHPEHYDERLDLSAAGDHDTKRICDGVLGPRSTIPDASDSAIMRLFDQLPGTY